MQFWKERVNHGLNLHDLVACFSKNLHRLLCFIFGTVRVVLDADVKVSVMAWPREWRYCDYTG